MAPSTGRVLGLLELLQAVPGATAAELAGRLSVDERTVRRYAAHLCDLGIPVQARRGRHGGFRLAPGYRLPPLMLTDDEAVAVVVGLANAAAEGDVAGARTALAKIRRVLPVPVADRVRTMLAALDAGQATTEQPAEPAAGQPAGRSAEPAPGPAVGEAAGPAADEAADEVYELDVTLLTSVEDARRHIPATVPLEADPAGGVRLRGRVERLDAMASLLAGLGCPFLVHRPAALRAEVRALARRLAAYADR